MEDEARRRPKQSSLPTAHELQSALRCARLIDRTGVTVDLLRRSYRLVPYGGLYRSDDLIQAETLLINAGLLLADGDLMLPMNGLMEIAQASDSDGCEALLAALLHQKVPLWLIAASASSGSVLADELIPDEERRKLCSVLGPESREALLLGDRTPILRRGSGANRGNRRGFRCRLLPGRATRHWRARTCRTCASCKRDIRSAWVRRHGTKAGSLDSEDGSQGHSCRGDQPCVLPLTERG